MQVRGLNPILTFTTVTAVLLAALAVHLFMGTGTTHADSTFNPTTSVKYCNAMFAGFPGGLGGNPLCSDAGLVAGANPGNDFTTTLDIPSGDLNFSNVVTFAPQSSVITSGTTLGGGVQVGGLRSFSSLGVLNGACNQAIQVDFVFYNVPLPNNPGDPRASTNIIQPRNEGQSNRFGAWGTPGVPDDGADGTPGEPPTNAAGDNVNDANSDLIADSSEEALNNYPIHILNLFDPDYVPGIGDNADGGANSPPIIPKALYGGLSNVVNNWIPLYFAQFDPGQLTPLGGAAGKMFAEMGAPNQSVLNDPGTTKLSPSSITDFCSPLNVTTMLLGNTTAGARTQNPAAGTQFVQQYVASLRDLDQDSFESAFDTCNKVTNVGTDRLGTGDTDGDGLNDACDSGGFSQDIDGDGFQNRQDPCPLNADTDGLDSEISVIGGGANADLGPKTDSIGDVCDNEAPNPVTVTQNNKSINITMSDTVGNGRYHAVVNVVAKCFSGTDNDADGYCSTQEGGQDSNAIRHGSWTAIAAMNFLVDPTKGIDSDGDNFTDAHETLLGRNEFCVTNVGHTPASCGGSNFIPRMDAVHSCAQTHGAVGAPVNDEHPWDNWPFDFNDNGLANTLDIATFVPPGNSRLNKAVNVTPADDRWDLNADGFVNTLDIARFTAGSPTHLNKGCGPSTADVPPVPAWSQQ